MNVPLNEALVPERHFRRSLDLATGIFFGGLDGARGTSVTHNIVSSALFAAAINGINTLFSQQKFLSRETLVSTTAITAVSAVMHALTKSKTKRYNPSIQYAPSFSTPQDVQSWTSRMADETSQEMVRH